MPGGRPTSYKPEYCQAILDFFEEERPAITHDGKTFYPPRPPLIKGFANRIGVHDDTLLAWADTIEEFSVSYKQAKQLQWEWIATRMLNGEYSGGAAALASKNIIGFRDEQHIDHTTKGDKIDSEIPETVAKLLSDFETKLRNEYATKQG